MRPTGCTKRAGRIRTELDNKLAWLREALEMENYTDTTREFIDNVRKDFFGDYVYVLTPQGKIIDLPAGSTPLDFAYRIHSNIGNRTQHVKVNGAIVRLDYKLKTNDVGGDHHIRQRRAKSGLAQAGEDPAGQGEDPPVV